MRKDVERPSPPVGAPVGDPAGRDGHRRADLATDALAVSGAWGTDEADAPIGRLAVDAVRVSAEASLPTVDALFRRDDDLRCVVVDALEGPVLVDRSWFQAVMTGRMGFGRVLHSRRRIGELQPEETLVFRADTSVSRAAATIISGTLGTGVLHAGLVHHVVVERADGRLGVVAVAEVFESLALHYAHQSLHDPLTGLPNRTHLVERLHGAGRRGVDVTLFFIDLDRFKDVNDQHGHAAGDEVLTGFAARLQSVARSGDLVARLAGDEFALLTEAAATRADRASLAERIVRAAAEPFAVHGGDGRQQHHVQVGASVGVAHTEHGGPGPAAGQLDALLKHADLAMYRAKAHGRGRHVHFDPDLVEDETSVAARSTRRSVERRLRTALAHPDGPGGAGLAVHYQPVVELPSGRVVGAEALVRWQDAELGRVTPDTFIPVAESSGLVLDLGLWVLRTACEEAVSWCPDGSDQAGAPTVAVNVSAVQLAQRSFVADVTGVLARSGLAPHRLHLEITETAAITDLAETAELLGQLRALGVQLSLDDFGTGHSSLTMLRTLPVHQVKIDRSFVEGVAERASDAVLVRLVIEAAHGLGLRVCAEGIERLEQVRQLVAMGCDEAQGWLFGRPSASSPALRSLLADRGVPVGAAAVEPGAAALDLPAVLPLGTDDELVVVSTPERVVTYASAASLVLLGRTPREMVGTSVAEHLHEDVRERAWSGEVLAALHTDGTAVHRALHRDGSVRWLQTTSRWLHDHRGDPVEVLSVSRDVTGTVTAEHALRDSELRFRMAFDEAPTGMAITRLDGTFERVNHAFAVLLGYSAPALLGLTVPEITHPEDRAADTENLAEMVRGAEHEQDVLKRYLHADGHPVPVRVRAALLDGRAGVDAQVVAHVTPR